MDRRRWKEDKKCNRWTGEGWKKNHGTRRGRTKPNMLKPLMGCCYVLKGPILSAWSPVVPEVAQLPSAKFFILNQILLLNGARQEQTCWSKTRASSRRTRWEPEIMISQHGRRPPVGHWASCCPRASHGQVKRARWGPRQK